ncbi:unnamed protein product, partial [Rotaria sp. Silwood2]
MIAYTLPPGLSGILEWNSPYNGNLYSIDVRSGVANGPCSAF